MLWWTLRQLKSKDTETRRSAAEKLGKSGNAKAVKPLIAALKDSEWIVRHYTATALGEIGDPQAVEPLIVALKDSDRYHSVRPNAVKALGEIGDARAVEPLINALNDPDVCVGAAVALGKIGDPQAAKYLANAAVSSVTKDSWTKMIATKRATNIQAAKSLIQVVGESQAIALLTEMLAIVDKDIRENTESILHKLDPKWATSKGAKEAVPTFLSSLNNESREMRKAALWALQKVKDERAFDAVILALNDKDETVQFIAAETLGAFADIRATSPLITACIKDDCDKVWESAMNALKRIPNWAESEAAKGEIPKLIEALNQQKNRKMALLLLEKIGDTQASDTVAALLNDEDEDIRSQAMWTLVAIKDPRGVEPLLSILKGSDYDGRDSFDYYGRYSRSRLAEVLEEFTTATYADIANTVTEELRTFRGEQTLERIATNLQNIDNREKRGITIEDSFKLRDTIVADLLTLESISHPNVMPLLAEALQHIEGGIPEAATTVLINIGGKEASLLLHKAIKNSFNGSEILRKLGETHQFWAVPLLIKNLKSNYAKTNAAAFALGEIGDPRAVEPLISALKVDSFDTLRIVAVALGRIADPRAIEPLIACIAVTPNNDVRKDIAEALIRLGNWTGLKELILHASNKCWDSEHPSATDTASHAVKGLIYIIERYSPLIPESHLQEIVALKKDGYYVEIGGWDCVGFNITGKKPKKPNFSTVKQLARQELIRRGIEA